MDLNNTQFLRPAVPIGFKAKISPEKQKEILNHLVFNLPEYQS